MVLTILGFQDGFNCMDENKMPIVLKVIQKNRVVLGGNGWSPNTTQFKLEAFWDIGGGLLTPPIPNTLR